MPVAIFSLPWFMAVAQLYNGLNKGEMREYLRSDYAECGHDRPPKYCHRDREPKTFWLLFAFYLLIAIIVPIGIAYALTAPTEKPKQNLGVSHTEKAASV